MARWLTRLFWALAGLYAALVAWAATVLPERVPAHWSGTEAPDRWGSRTEAIVMLVVLGVVMVGTFGTLISYAPRSLSHTWVNLPFKSFWQRPEHLPQAMRMISVDFGVLGCLAVAFCCAVPVSIVEAAASTDAALPGWTVPVLVGWLVLTLGYTLWMTTVRWRPPPEARGRF